MLILYDFMPLICIIPRLYTVDRVRITPGNGYP